MRYYGIILGSEYSSQEDLGMQLIVMLSYAIIGVCLWGIMRKYHKKHLKKYVQINEDLTGQAMSKERLHSVVHNEGYIITGNSMLDMLVNEKYSRACNQNIEMKVNISLPEKIGMGSIELCKLLNNILNYALDECERIGEERERSISIEGVWYKGYVMFKVYYTTPEEINEKCQCNLRHLIKYDMPNETYELKNIVKSIHKYQGEIDVQSCGWGEKKLTFSLNAV